MGSGIGLRLLGLRDRRVWTWERWLVGEILKSVLGKSVDGGCVGRRDHRMRRRKKRPRRGVLRLVHDFSKGRDMMECGFELSAVEKEV